MSRFVRMKPIQSAGQGDVWISLDEMASELVAQKFLRLGEKISPNRESLMRFQREVEAQSRLQHANVMPIVEFDFQASPPWYAMPLATGSLQDRLDTGIPLSSDELGEIIDSIFGAVAFAHDAGLIHRDIKPANLLRLVDDGESRWTIADFGVCRDIRAESGQLTKSGIALGSARYMPPEQADQPHFVGPTADVYALGCVIYYCVTGTEPGLKLLNYGRIPDRYHDVLVKATAPGRADRYPSVVRFRQALESVSGSASPDTNTTPSDVCARIDAQERLLDFASTKQSLNDLDEGALYSLTQDILVSMGHQVELGQSAPNVAFLAIDHLRGSAPVIIRKRNYFTASTDLAKATSAMASGGHEWAIFVTSGQLSPEARKLSQESPNLVALEGPSIRSYINSLIQSNLDAIGPVSDTA